jgi:phosphoribosylanthranilate isomerase
MSNKTFQIKVCGMREEQNISDLLLLNPDLIGFIFYPKSPRFVSNKLLNNKSFYSIPLEKKVAVGVNESIENVLEIAKNYQFQNIQLHGQETPDYCQKLKENGFTIFKAFGINESFDFQQRQTRRRQWDNF